MAVALLVGQALLVALIGWVTLGASSAPHGKPATVDEMAAAPARRPMPNDGRHDPAPPGLFVPPPLVPSSSHRSSSPRIPSSPRLSSSHPPAPAAPAPSLPMPIPSPSSSAADPSLKASVTQPPAPPAELPSVSPRGGATPTQTTQSPVTVGEECDPEGAFGSTAQGTVVRCEADDPERPRWKIV